MNSIFENLPEDMKPQENTAAPSLEAENFGLDQLVSLTSGLNVSCIVANSAALYAVALETCEVEVEPQTQEVMEVNDHALSCVLDSLESYGLEADKDDTKDSDDKKPGLLSRAWGAIKKFLIGIKDWFAKQWGRLSDFIKGIFGIEKKVDAALKKGETVKISVASVNTLRERSEEVFKYATEEKIPGLVTHAKSALASLAPLRPKGDETHVETTPATVGKAKASVAGMIRACEAYSKDMNDLATKTLGDIKKRLAEANAKREETKLKNEAEEIKKKGMVGRTLGRTSIAFKSFIHAIKVWDREGSVVEIK